MDLALLIDKYLSNKAELRTEDDSFNIADGSIFRWDFANIPCPTPEELAALAPVVEAEQISVSDKAAALKFLQDTDYKVTKYRDQVDMGRTPDLTVEEFQYLLTQRQQARDKI